MRLIHLTLAALLVSAPAFAVPRAALDAKNKPNFGAAAAVEGDFTEVTGQERQDTIVRIETYLSAIPSVVAKFTQESSDGSTGTGQFFLKRPGKMRWEYNPPVPALLVSDGKTITYHDITADQVSYIGIDDTLASFLIKKQVKLDNETFKLTRLEKGEGLIRATVIQRKKPSEGNLTLEFKDAPMEIVRMVALDATGNETRVRLVGARFGPVLDDKMFVFVDPRGVNDRRNRKKLQAVQ
jgi:outer membrane lipoprotein-sorting protein